MNAGISIIALTDCEFAHAHRFLALSEVLGRRVEENHNPWNELCVQLVNCVDRRHFPANKPDRSEDRMLEMGQYYVFCQFFSL